jgi:hypothetical protein
MRGRLNIYDFEDGLPFLLIFGVKINRGTWGKNGFDTR